MNEQIKKDKSIRQLGQVSYLDNLFGFDGASSFNADVTSTSYIDVADSEIDITLDKATTILILMSAQIANAVLSSNYMTLSINIDGSEVGAPIVNGGLTSYISGMTHYTVELAEGDHTVKARAKVSGGEVYCINGQITVLQLGVK